MPAIQLVAVLSQKRSSAFGLRIRPSSFIPQEHVLSFASRDRRGHHHSHMSAIQLVAVHSQKRSSAFGVYSTQLSSSERSAVLSLSKCRRVALVWNSRQRSSAFGLIRLSSFLPLAPSKRGTLCFGNLIFSPFGGLRDVVALMGRHYVACHAKGVIQNSKRHLCVFNTVFRLAIRLLECYDSLILTAR